MRRTVATGPDIWDIRPWCEQFGCGVSTFFVLNPPPLSVKVGKLRKIVESPGDYARRVAEIRARNSPGADRKRLVGWVESKINLCDGGGEEAGAVAEEIVSALEEYFTESETIGNQKINERKD